MARTLEDVLRQARADLASGERTPHCYRAWVQGKGYVSDGGPVFDRADYLRQLDRSVESEIENMGYASGYAEPGHDDPARGVLLADWNVFPRDFDRDLEALGYAIEWSDEWSVCEDCNRAFRTEPDSFDWRPVGQTFEGFNRDGYLTLCRDCLQDYATNNREEE
jgi:hypothetical protein